MNRRYTILTSFVVDSSASDDANFISDVEISTNLVNECGRTLLGGNIDIGEQTENALADGNVTQATAGSRVAVLIQQVNETGAGPFTCDMDETGNSIGVSGQTKLDVKEAEANKNGVITLRVALPNDLACTGCMAFLTLSSPFFSQADCPTLHLSCRTRRVLTTWP